MRQLGIRHEKKILTQEALKMQEAQTVEQTKEMLATKRHKRHKKILNPAKALRRKDFRPERGYAVVAGSRDEVQHFLRRAQAG